MLKCKRRDVLLTIERWMRVDTCALWNNARSSIERAFILERGGKNKLDHDFAPLTKMSQVAVAQNFSHFLPLFCTSELKFCSELPAGAPQQWAPRPIELELTIIVFRGTGNVNRSTFHPLDMIGEKANFVVRDAIPNKHFCFGCWVRTREQVEERKKPSHMVNMRKESSEMPSST